MFLLRRIRRYIALNMSNGYFTGDVKLEKKTKKMPSSMNGFHEVILQFDTIESIIKPNPYAIL